MPGDQDDFHNYMEMSQQDWDDYFDDHVMMYCLPVQEVYMSLMERLMG